MTCSERIEFTTKTNLSCSLSLSLSLYMYMSTGRNDQPKRYTTNSVRRKPMSGASRANWRNNKMYFGQNVVDTQRIFDLTDAFFSRRHAGHDVGSNIPESAQNGAIYPNLFFGWVVCSSLHIYIYIYSIRIWRLTAPVKSHKVQLEAMHRSKQSDFESSSSDFERSVASKEKEACSSSDFERKSGFKARSSSDFERSVASKRARAGISSEKSKHIVFSSVLSSRFSVLGAKLLRKDTY
jgi:hypothetical protein